MYAVVGASNDQRKYGNKVLSFLKQKGYNVVPINPKENSILGLKCYPNLTECVKDNEIEWVVTVVPPEVTEQIVKECNILGIKHVRMQPGSESQEAIRFCEKNGIEAVTACIMR